MLAKLKAHWDILVGLAMVSIVAWFFWSLYHQGRQDQAAKDQPRLTGAAVTGAGATVGKDLQGAVSKGTIAVVNKEASLQETLRNSRVDLRPARQGPPPPSPQGEAASVPANLSGPLVEPLRRPAVVAAYRTGLERLREYGTLD